MEKIFVIVLLFISVQTFGQFTEDFSDGDFTANPAWNGDTGEFVISNSWLRSNGPNVANSKLHLQTTNTKMDNAEWNFLVNLTFNPTATTFVRVYLASSQANLEGALQGYYIQIGQTNADFIKLFRQDGTTSTTLLTGSTSLGTGSILVRIKVKRSNIGTWQVLASTGGGTNFASEGTVTDNTYTTSSYFGFQCSYATASRYNQYYFDDVSIVTDVAPPVLQSVQAVSATELELAFNESLNEVSAETTANFSCNNSLGTPTTASLQGDEKTIRLTFANAFSNGIQNQLTIAGIQDIAGNTMSTASASFLYFLSQPAQFNDLIISELLPDPSPQIGLPAYEFVEVFNRSTKVFDLNGWGLTDGSTTGVLPSTILLPGEYLVITNSTVAASFAPFGKVIGVANFPTLNNSGDAIKLSDPDDTKIDSVHYDQSWYQDDDKALGGWTLERLNAAVNTNEPINWLASQSVSGGTPGKQNSVFGKNPDSKPPTLLTLTVSNQKELLLQFNEALSLEAEALTHYTLNETLAHPDVVTFAPDHKSIQLHFDKSFTNGASNTLTISGVQDLANNVMPDLQKSFVYFVPVPVQSKDILIIEIMADPTPVVQLPEAEFIEIYNHSSSPFDLGGWKLFDATGSATLSSYILMPNEFLILTSTTNASKFSSFGKTLGVTSFPSLNNSGEPIVIRDGDGKTIDSVSYKSSWYQDKVKQDGGWSLERLLYDFSTTDSTNWRAADDIAGGTPGKSNSVLGKNPDAKAPQLLSVEVVDNKTLLLRFDEPLAVTTPDISHFNVRDFELPVSALLADDKKSIRLSFAVTFTNGVNYILKTSGMSDLAGNVLNEAEKTFRYFISVPAQATDILITEIMADPSPVVQLPEAEFVEIYNRSSSPFDLADWKLSDATGSAKLSSYILLPNEFLILTSTTNAAKFTSFGKTLGVTSFPSLNNSGEPIVLKNSDGLTLDSITYKLSWYQDKAKQDGGWSLERLLYDFSTTDSTNWRASADLSGGTPGKLNSVLGKNPDSNPPKLLSVDVTNNKTLLLSFDEMLAASASDVTHYEAGNVMPVTAAILTDKKSVRLSFAAPFINGIDFVLRVSGIADQVGNVMNASERTCRYFVATAAKAKDIQITEIMADPSPVVQLPEAEFIEIYNRSISPFDLSGWKLSDATTTATLPAYIILPNEYLILTSTTNASKFSSFGKALGVSAFPSLNNAGEAIVLRNSDHEMIDSVNFSSTWYRDDDRADGGWSLELIDPQNVCGEEDNWAVAEDDRGGTPGKSNSVLANKPDLTGPTLTAAIPTTSHELLLQFDEKLERAIQPTSFRLNPDVEPIKGSFTNPSLREIKLELAKELEARTLYEIKISKANDCAGNPIRDTYATTTFALPEAADSLDLVINEVLFNPRPGGVDFVEIYNQSVKYINLKDWKLGNVEDGHSKNEKLITGNNSILAPHSYVVFTSDPEILKNNYPQSNEKNFMKTDLPSLPDDEGSLRLVSGEGKTIDQLLYSKNEHSPLIKNDEGVSLERISFAQATNDPSNWKSASASSGYATPGDMNSNARPDDSPEQGKIVVTPEVFSNRSGSGDFTQIHYRFEQSGSVANVRVYDIEGRLIKEISNNELLGYEGFFRWEGDSSEGNRVRSGYYTIWVQVYNLEGETQTVLKRVVVTSR